VVLFAAAVARGATGVAAPRKRVRVLLPELATQTLPPRSTAMPAGVASDESVRPPEGETGAPELENRLTESPVLVTQT
jgi:hypothetical protein